MLKEFYNEDGDLIEKNITKKPQYLPETGRIHMLIDGSHMSFAISHDVAELQTAAGRIEIEKAMRESAADSNGFLRYDETRHCLIYASDGATLGDEDD